MSNKSETCLINPKNRQCDGICQGCGWDFGEAARRKAIIRDGGLQRGNDGLKRLHIKKEEITTDGD